MSLQEVLESVRSSPEPSDEESAKFKVIAPILASLGWDPFGPQVLLEHSVGGQKGGGRVDFALEGSRGIVALIEAKKPGTDLSQNISQLLWYAFHEAADICALTNGLEWRLYLPRVPGERCFAVLKIKEDPIRRSAEDLDAFLSLRALETMAGRVSEAEAHASRVLEAKLQPSLLEEKMPDIWDRMMTDADEELVELVTKRVYEELNLRPNKQQVAAVIRSQPVTPTPLPPQPVDRKRSRFRRNPRLPVPTSVLLFGTRYPCKTHRDGLGTVADVLYDRDPNAFTKLMVLRGRSRPHLSRNPEELTRPKQVRMSGIFVETNLSGQQMWERARLFMRHLGYSEDDLALEYDRKLHR